MRNLTFVAVLCAVGFFGCGSDGRLVPVPDGGPIDPAPVDPPPPAFAVTVVNAYSDKPVAVAVCPEGLTAISGGCNCNGDPWYPTPNSSARLSMPLTTGAILMDRYSCMCNGVNAGAMAVCARVSITVTY